MSTRSQVLIKSKDLNHDVYLYKHHDGYDLPKIVAGALKDLKSFEANNVCKSIFKAMICESGYSAEQIDDNMVITVDDIDFKNVSSHNLNCAHTFGLGRFEICDSIHGDIQVLVVVDLNEQIVRVITDYTGDGKHIWEFIAFSGFIDYMVDIQRIEDLEGGEIFR
jgi:hypothetical protein